MATTVPVRRTIACDGDRARHDPPSAEPQRRLRLPTKLIAFAGVLCAGVLIGWVVFRDDGDSRSPAASGPSPSGSRPRPASTPGSA